MSSWWRGLSGSDLLFSGDLLFLDQKNIKVCPRHSARVHVVDLLAKNRFLHSSTADLPARAKDIGGK
jgi:hypothetical protein